MRPQLTHTRHTQIYIDFIFKDIPFLKRWVEMEWEAKWTHEFSAETSKYVASYSFFTYFETWERPEVKAALRSSPALMMWDDHGKFPVYCGGTSD